MLSFSIELFKSYLYEYKIAEQSFYLPYWFIFSLKFLAYIYFIYCAIWFVRSGIKYINNAIERINSDTEVVPYEFDSFTAKKHLICCALILIALFINTLLCSNPI